MRINLDYVLYFIIFVCSYLYMGVWGMISSFIPVVNAIGYDFICFLLSFILFFYSIKRGYKIKNGFIYFFVLSASLFSAIKFVETCYYAGFVEAITIYRKGYILLPTFALCYRYISNMSLFRMKRFIQWMQAWVFPLAALYLLQCAGVPLFSSINTQTVEGVSVVRNILGMPPVVPVIFALAWIALLDSKKRKNIVFASLCLFVIFVSFTRNLLASAVLICIVSSLLYICKYGIKDNYKLLGYVIGGLMLIVVLMPNALSFWGALANDTFNNQLKNDTGTYAFRERLIEQVIERNECLGVTMAGQGYVRDVKKGEYSIVLGTDTYVAPILWCEGFIGVTLRALIPFAIACMGFFIYRRSKNKTAILLGVAVVSVVVVQIPNYVQTEIIMRFNHTIPLTYMLLRYAQICHLNRREITYA